MTLPSTRLGLKSIEPLIVDDNNQSVEVVTAILMGFGVNRTTKCNSVADAREVLARKVFDIAIIDCEMPDEDGFDLVRHIRSDPNGGNFTLPILMMSATTPQWKVEVGRDCGANFTIAKPVSPTTLLERMLWIAKGDRLFISDPGYTGPDRRFHRVPLPPGTAERRAAEIELTAKPERALSQDEISGLFA